MISAIRKLVSGILPRGSISRDAVLIVVGDGITFTSVFLTAMVLARIIPVTAMATYRQIIYLGAMAQSIVEFGLSSSIYRFWNLLDDRGRSTYIKMQLSLAMSLGALASIALAVLAPFLATWFDNPDLRLALWICAASPLVNIVPLTIRPVFICRGRPLTATFIQMFFSLAMSLAIIIPFAMGADLYRALVFWMLVNLIEVFLTFYILRSEIFSEAPIWNRQYFADTWAYFWPIQAGRLPAILNNNVDKISTSVFLSTEAFAAYSLGARELPFIGKIGQSISSVMIPRLVLDHEAGRIENLCRRWKRACERTSLITYPIIGFSIWFSGPMVRFMFSSTYAESRIPFAIYSAIAFFRVIEYASLAKILGNTGLILRTSLVSSAIFVVLAFPMTAWFGMWGISSVVFIAVLVAVANYLFAYSRQLRVPLSTFYPWKQLLILASASVLIAGLVGTLFEPWLGLTTDTSTLSLGIKLFGLLVVDALVYLLFLLATCMLSLDRLGTLFRDITPAQNP